MTQTAQPTSTNVLSRLELAPSVDAGQVIMLIIYLILIIVGAYYLTRYVANRRLRQGMRGSSRAFQSSKSTSGPGHMVAVVDRIAIDREKTLMVVEFEGKYYLIGTTPQEMRLMGRADITEEDLERERQEAAKAQSAPAHPEGQSDETFGQRFRRAFSIVLQSYLPKRMRKEPEAKSSFSRELQARMNPDDTSEKTDNNKDS